LPVPLEAVRFAEWMRCLLTRDLDTLHLVSEAILKALVPDLWR
jgi:hypothetical protein